MVGCLGSALLAASPSTAILAASLAVAATPSPPAPDSLLRAADAARHPIEEGVLTIRATVAPRTPEPPAISDVEVFVRGTADTLAVFRGGPLAGRRILDAGGKTWLIVPGAKRPIPVSASQRLMGGASIGDLARLRFADDFTATARAEVEAIDGVPCRVLDLAARRPGAPYAGGVLWIDADDALPRRARLTLPSGKPAKEVRFSFARGGGGRPALERMEIDHLIAAEPVTHTTLELVAAAPRPLDAAIFTPAGAAALP